MSSWSHCFQNLQELKCFALCRTDRPKTCRGALHRLREIDRRLLRLGMRQVILFVSPIRPAPANGMTEPLPAISSALSAGY